MGEAVQALTAGPDIDLQPASVDIWDKKYRLKDRAESPVDREIIDTYKRVARALADAEESDAKRKQWYQRFVWALQNGALPAGRIISNAGAQAYKPSTSTINCTVSGSIVDSMDDILNKNHEAGMTLKAGCGIGYEFSTLRPKGAYVSGAGAYTSGPLSFMDIYDKMCFTVSSAGGRRGAQMATFDINHPDVLDFIRAKRENARLRQFNLSLLITTEFIEAVKAGTDWPLSFPMTEKEATESGIDLQDPTQVVWRPFPVKKDYLCNDTGDVACRVYKTVPAQRLWDMIMASTYDFAEPGFILIDKVNEMNNNWWQESIRATNPCGEQPLGPVPGAGRRQTTPVDRRAFRTATKPVVLQTREGHHSPDQAGAGPVGRGATDKARFERRQGLGSLPRSWRRSSPYSRACSTTAWRRAVEHPANSTAACCRFPSSATRSPISVATRRSTMSPSFRQAMARLRR